MPEGVDRCSQLHFLACRRILLVMLLGSMYGHRAYALFASQGPEPRPMEDLHDETGRSNDGKEDATGVMPISTMDHQRRYGNHARSQQAYLGLYSDHIVNSLRDGDFVLDLGGADGMISASLLAKMVVKNKNFTYGLLDLPNNDWDTARAALGGIAEMIAPQNGVIDAESVVQNGPCKKNCQLRLPGIQQGPGVMLMAGSFYHQVAPTKSVNIAFSGTAVHFLSGSKSGPPMLQAQEDWYDFLKNRAEELAIGGILYVTGLAKQFVYPAGSFMASQNVLHKCLEMASTMGIIDKGASLSWRFPTYSRSEHEWTRPFDENMFPSLVLDSYNLVSLPSPYWAESHGDRFKFANAYVPSIMAWLGPYLEETLGTQFAMFYASKLLEDIVANPTPYIKDYLQAVMTIRKV